MVTSSGRPGLPGRALAAIRRGIGSVRWTRLATVVLVVAVAAGLGLIWSLNRGPAPVVATGQPTSPGTGGPLPDGQASTSSAPLPSASAPTDPGASSSSSSSSATASTRRPVPQAINPAAIPTISACLVPRQFTVLTFNIHGGRTDHGVDLPAVAAEIKAAKADVVLLQEVDKNLARTGFRDEPDVLAQELGMNVYYSSPVRSNAILTSFPVTEWSSTPLPLWPGREQRRLVHATVLVSGQAVNVFTTHLDQSFKALRLLQIRAAERLMAPYADQPTILGGDLNSVSGSAVLTSLDSRLRDSWSEVGSGPGDTVPARNPRIRIDFVLHNSWLTPRAAQVLPSSASDHRSVRVSFDLWGQADCTG